MIGGIDTAIPTPGVRDPLYIAVRVIRQYWPKAVFENGETGERYEFWQVPFGEVIEVFVYRDGLIADQWDAEGAVPELLNTMIHLIAEREALIVVVDDKVGEMQNVIDSILSALADPIHHVAAKRSAA